MPYDPDAMLAAVPLLLFFLLQGAVPPPPGPGDDVLAGREYRLGPDDAMKVTVHGHPDLDQEVVVAADGSIDFPLIGRLPARERTAREMEAAIGERLAQGFLSDPQVRVVITLYRSKTVFVMGELTRPGTYPLPEGRTLVEVLSRAGPLLPSAGAEVLVLRARPGASGTAEGQGEVIRVDLQDLQSGLLTQNPVLRPSDTVFVPKAAKVFVSGEVRQPGAYTVLRGTTVRQAIALAGGFGERAARGRVRILRSVDGRPLELPASLEDPVSAGDTLVVERKKGIF
jgi:polysaccharide biosynthesis/export protein